MLLASRSTAFRGLRRLGALLLCAATLGGAADASELVIPLLAQAPVIDGTLSAAELAGCARLDGFLDGGQLVRRHAQAYIGATADAFYIAIRSQLPDSGPLLSAVTADSTKVVFDDSVEIYVTPTPGAADRVCYQLAVNSLGHGGYNLHPVGAARESLTWRGGWQQAHGQADGWWTAEFLVPVKSMAVGGGDRAITAGSWLINATRNWKPEWEWSSLGGAYAHAGVAVRVVPEAPVISCSIAGDPTFPPASLALDVANPGARPLTVKAELGLVRNNMPALGGARELTIAPGGHETLRLALDAADPTTIYDLSARVASADGHQVFFDRPLHWTRAKGALVYAGGAAKAAPALDAGFAYYPSANRLRVVADISGMPATAKLAQVVGEVRPVGGVPLDRFTLPASGFVGGRCEIERQLPPLEGEYQLVLHGEGVGVPAGETIKTFERRRFPWEGNPMGRSTTVYPPFTPIAVDGGHLRTVLREHRLNGVGLLDQVVATSAQTGVAKPLLAAPMRYVVAADGALATASSSAPLRVVSAAGDRVVTAGSFAAGPLRADWRGTWDYDGCLKVELTLQPSAGRAIDALTLEIPLDAASATMLHANSDRIRAPIARRLAAADGPLWDARELACDDYIKNFAPYVFVGDAVRGLCWFAENDRGWGWDPATPNARLTREDGAVMLRIALIDRATVIDQPRTITFGLLAAPVKPRYVAKGQSPDWWRYRYLRQRGTLLGTDINWGAITSCGALYPAGIPLGEDLSVWDLIRRGNLGEVPKDEIDRTVARLAPLLKPYEPESWEHHLRSNLVSRRGKTMYFYFNRASAQLFPEFETFKDEWSLDDLRNVGKGTSNQEIKIVPSASYIDQALWWYAKSFELGGNHGVYWDNWFIAPSLNTRQTDAWRRPDGSIHPAAGIWGLRELAKRTFTMMNERGMDPVTFPHMTSFSCLPMLSFAVMQYDWEWKYSEGDVQDRFTRDYIQLASSGELAGTWPNPLHDQGAQADDPWTQRTFTAVRILHELDGLGGWGDGGTATQREQGKLFAPIAALLDRPGLQVWRYWDERPQPVRTTDPDLPTIVYAVPGERAVAAVVSYRHDQAEVRLSVDAKALGMEAGWRVADAVSGETLAAGDGAIAAFPLKAHDLRVLIITPEKR